MNKEVYIYLCPQLTLMNLHFLPCLYILHLPGAAPSGFLFFVDLLPGMRFLFHIPGNNQRSTVATIHCQSKGNITRHPRSNGLLVRFARPQACPPRERLGDPRSDRGSVKNDQLKKTKKQQIKKNDFVFAGNRNSSLNILLF